MTSVGWLGLPPVAWSLIAVVSSIVGLWLLGLAARRVRGWLRVGVRLLAGFQQFVLVLCGLSIGGLGAWGLSALVVLSVLGALGVVGMAATLGVRWWQQAAVGAVLLMVWLVLVVVPDRVFPGGD